MNDQPAVRFDRVVKAYGEGATEVRALSGLSLDIGSGEFVAVMGPSGCGKSTIAAALAARLGAALLPMDGYHLANVELARDRKSVV